MTVNVPPGDAANHTYEVHGRGGWSALYIDGHLDTGPGENYHIRERLEEILGIVRVDDDAYLRGGDGYDGKHATTLEEVTEYRTARQVRLDRAATLRAEATRLAAEAAALEQEARR